MHTLSALCHNFGYPPISQLIVPFIIKTIRQEIQQLVHSCHKLYGYISISFICTLSIKVASDSWYLLW